MGKLFITARPAATKIKVKNFTAEVARKSGERRGNLTTKEHDIRAKDTRKAKNLCKNPSRPGTNLIVSSTEESPTRDA
jgi:hypothetical protein